MYTIGVETMLFSGSDYNLFLPYSLSEDFRQQFPYSYQEEYSSFKPGVYLISVCRMLDPYMMSSAYSREDAERGLSLRRFLNIKPDAKIGHTLWVYNLTPEDIARLRLADMRFFYYNHVRYRGSDDSR
jgi:hypothetical protein